MDIMENQTPPNHVLQTAPIPAQNGGLALGGDIGVERYGRWNPDSGRRGNSTRRRSFQPASNGSERCRRWARGYFSFGANCWYEHTGVAGRPYP